MDTVSYLIGKKKGVAEGAGTVVMDGESGYEFTDPNHDGNIVVTAKEENE